MDLLESLNVDDLPEQQTRFSHLLHDSDDFGLKLGFDACCACGKKNPNFDCPSCRRVKYCSETCCRADSSLCLDGDIGEEAALGHTSVICSLLNLCTDDEVMEGKNPAEISALDKGQQTSATDRLASEFESYPATLANVIMDGAPYQNVLKKCAGKGITIHVIGASQDSELWQGHPDPIQEKKVFEGYADALAEIAEKNKLSWIRLHFFGPELCEEMKDRTTPIPPVQATKSRSNLIVRMFQKSYRIDNNISPPDIAVFFNPGFTCTDYDWEQSLSFLRSNEIPFLVATNTEMECMADIQYLMDRQLFQDIPAGLKSVLLGEEGIDGDEDEEDDSVSFLSLNPYAGLRVRQSGTMANDVYVKSRWIFGGISGGISERKRQAPPASAQGDNSRQELTTVKKRKTTGSGNSKTSNPALI
ncbi:hypothetical protein IV203_027795 [Nitzschia inconspicua]|uniref:Mitochondrial splicing suppressor 51-like C-terminal domain-containing protein n=1 Tax=Nitzschia inconspicua TaxID=303405 RepID=A0A9K3Q6D9_9STRA|nr:hypothetical protein IV203_027795 [Nitzschia inconspicua]